MGSSDGGSGRCDTSAVRAVQVLTADRGSVETVQSSGVSATAAALQLVASLVEEHGELMFHQSGGCCDGSSPMCYPRGELQLGERDLCIGEVGGQPFYVDRHQYQAWGQTPLLIDVVTGRGGMFSLEGPRGVRFHTRSADGSDLSANRAEPSRSG